MHPRRELQLSILILAVALPVSAAGLLHPGLYRDSAVILPQAFGQDLVTLLFAAPLLAVGTAWMARGSVRGRLVWLGALGYFLYTYATYAFGARWNELFLGYVALLGLSVFSFAAGLARTDAAGVHARFGPRTPRRSVGVFLVLVAVVVALAWLAENVTAIVRGEPPASVARAEIPTSYVHVMDLGIVLPAALMTGVLLLRRAPFGFVLAGVLLVKFATLGLAVVAMGLFMRRAGIEVPGAVLAGFGGLTCAALALATTFLRAIEPPHLPAATPTPGMPGP